MITPQHNTTFIQKVGLVVFGVFLFLIFLEGGLRLGGGVLIALKEYRMKISLSTHGDYRILCVGESTTDGQWPPILAEILNDEEIGIQFTVIDEGKGGADSGVILSRLTELLDTYEPDMVITMMGINDGWDTVPYEDTTPTKVILFVQDIRVYKLAKLLWEHIAAKGFTLREAYAASGVDEDREAELRTAIEKEPDDTEGYIQLGWYYRNQQFYERAHEMFKHAIALEPDNTRVYVDLALCYIDQKKYNAAGAMLDEAQKKGVHDGRIYYGLGRNALAQDNYRGAEHAYARAITWLARQGNDMSKEYYLSLLDLGWIYFIQKDFKKAEDLLQSAIALYPEIAEGYVRLGICYREAAQYEHAEKMLREAVALEPDNVHNYGELVECYLAVDDFEAAEKMLDKALAIEPADRRVNLQRAQCYKAQVGYLVELGKSYGAEGRYRAAVEKYEEARAVLVKAKAIDPYDDRIYRDFDLFSRSQKIYEQIERYEEAWQREPENVAVLYGLVNLYMDLEVGRYEDARKLLLMVIEKILPEESEYNLYGMLGRCDIALGDFAQAETNFKNAIAVNALDDRNYAGLALACLNQGKYFGAQRYFRKTKSLQLTFYNPATRYNYNRLRDIVHARGIRLVCVQYPLRSIAPLKKLLEDDPAITFVDNEQLFKSTIKAASYEAYFRDSFAGDTGHCTEEGNRLLAENIARAILRDYFTK